MPYIFKRKLDLRELVDQSEPAKRIIVAEPEEYLCAIYSYHLSSANFFVKPCGKFSELSSHISSFKPHMLVINGRIAGELGKTALWLKNVRISNPELLIVTLGKSTDLDSMNQIMKVGANAHLEPALTRPQDVVTIAHSLFFHN